MVMNNLENFTKMKKNLIKGCNPKNENALSFWATLFSTIFYISIFCIFNIHLSTTKFWFLISNTLILIIAADFGAFSSSSSSSIQGDYGDDDDLYQDYVRKTSHARTNNNIIQSYPEPRYNYYMKRQKTPPHPQQEETIKDVVVVEKVAPQEAKTLDIVVTHDHPSLEEANKEEEDHSPSSPQADDEKEETDELACSAIMVTGKEESRKIQPLQRSKSEKHYEAAAAAEEGGEESELSAMPVEELNRRAEEFIQRFNRQIRLQAARNRHNNSIFQAT